MSKPDVRVLGNALKTNRPRRSQRLQASVKRKSPYVEGNMRSRKEHASELGVNAFDDASRASPRSVSMKQPNYPSEPSHLPTNQHTSVAMQVLLLVAGETDPSLLPRLSKKDWKMQNLYSRPAKRRLGSCHP